jgi:hypothetical protein
MGTVGSPFNPSNRHNPSTRFPTARVVQSIHAWVRSYRESTQDGRSERNWQLDYQPLPRAARITTTIR